MSTLVIERQAVLQNLRQIKEKAKGARLIGDLSGDAYGLGLLELARMLTDEGVRSLIISSAREAERLRDAGFTEEQLMTLRSPADRAELELLVDLGVICAVGSYEAGAVLNAAAEEHHTVCDVQILMNCGEGRYGFTPEERDKIFALYENLHALRVLGVCAAFSQPDGKLRLLKGEFDRFARAVDAIEDAGYDPGFVFMADGLSLLRFPDCRLDGVRLGRELGGQGRFKGSPFRQAAYIESSVGELKWLRNGESVGGRKLHSTRRIAVLPIGGVNGFGLLPWQPGRKRVRQPKVTLNGKNLPLLGRVGVFDCSVDVTKMPCKVGDVAVLEAEALHVNGLRRAYR